MKLTLKQALNRGVEAHKKGRIQEAERFYRTVLLSDPKNSDANHNLGILAVSSNRASIALPLFKTALEANPRSEQFWLSYINVLIIEREFEKAERSIKQARKLDVDVEKLNVLKAQLTTRTSQDQPNNLTPPQDQLHNLLKYYQASHYDEAEQLAKKITQIFPAHQFAWKILGAVLMQTGRTAESLVPMQKAVQTEPKNAEALSNLGVTLLKLGKIQDAEASFKKAVALKPNYAEAHNNLGATFKEQGKLSEAAKSFSRATVVKPDYAEAHNNLGIMLKALGKLDQAKASYTQAISLAPYNAKAHRHLTLLKKFHSKDRQYSKMLEIYSDQSISKGNRCHINFALAKAYEDLEDFGEAFSHLKEGNLIRKKLLNYCVDQDRERFNNIKSTYPRIEQHSLELDGLTRDVTPIFIVGLPRSGTTLIEQIVSSHSKVTGAGELSFATLFGSNIVNGISEISTGALVNFRVKYLEKLKNVSEGRKIVIDKMPHNFLHIGLLAAAFPEAKIVHVKRNAAAVCWANYRQYFALPSSGYSHAIEDIVIYYKLYRDLMGFWFANLGNRIYELDYEQMTVSQENETRQVIKYLELGWEDRCLSPEYNTRSVATASNVQVREKIYKGSSEQWKRYRLFLDGALENLH
ncbi:MAG: tetratricopeptide repeat protein [Gammaproteobacteria bacterium]|nr:tetratricopeptide repeat protein [Gammaproteobacteria bacterium]